MGFELKVHASLIVLACANLSEQSRYSFVTLQGGEYFFAPRCPFRKSCTTVLPWERRAPARLQKPRWSVALPGKAVENWQWMYETDI
jgi:hypothetical protein